MFKYTFGNKTTLLDSHRSQKAPQRLDFGKTSYTDLVFARGEFLRFFGAPNESLKLIIIYYIFKYTFGDQTTLLDSHRSQKKPFKVSISAKLVIKT